MKLLRNILFLLVAGLLLSACGGGGGGSAGASGKGINLAWAAPSSRSDGSYLAPSELAGYRIYYGTTADNLSPLLDINDAYETRVSITDLPPGTYYFALSAYDANGEESGLSGVVTRSMS